MTSSLLKQPITESLEITLHIATYHPKLLPEQHRSTISALLEEAKEKARIFFQRIRVCLSNESTWILGTSSPRALDAHCVPFIARIMEADNTELVPTEVQQYAKKAKAGPEWNSIMEGKPILWSL
jgi:hypothetical protein